jgi:predicted aconitase with swiveling domain
MDEQVTGRVLVDGTAAGRVLATETPLSLWGGLDVEHVTIIDRRHPLHGQSLVDRVLVLPAGRGSSSASAMLLEAIVRGTAPLALLLGGVDEVMTMGVVVAEELFGASIPVLALHDGGFARALRASAAAIEPGGSVTLSLGLCV